MELGEAIAALQPLDRTAVVLDFDGTLAPIVTRPEDAAPLPGTVETLTSLVPRCAIVALVTGRPSADVAVRMPVPGLWIEGLYGLESPERASAPPLPPAVLARVGALVADHPGARIEDKGASVAVHVRETPDPDQAEVQLLRPLEAIAAEFGLDVAPGKRVLELMPSGRPRKGAAVERVIRRSGALAAVYAGDDEADLEAFAALERLGLQGLTTVRVAVRGAEAPAGLADAADLVVEGPAGLRAFLDAL